MGNIQPAAFAEALYGSIIFDINGLFGADLCIDAKNGAERSESGRQKGTQAILFCFICHDILLYFHGEPPFFCVP